MKRIRVYAGTMFDKNGFIIPDYVRTEAIRLLHELTSRQFGGVTMYYHAGSWVSSEGDLVAEPGITVEVLGDDAHAACEETFAGTVRDTFQQKSVVLTVETVAGKLV